MAKRDALVWARALVRALQDRPASEWSGLIGRTLQQMERMGDSAWIRRLPAVLPEALRREQAPAWQVRIAPATDTPALREQIAKALECSVQDLSWTTDPSLMAGVRVQTPSWMIDASVTGRLKTLGAFLSL